MSDLEQTLDKLGIRRGSLDAIRLSRGVVGKVAYVAFAALLVLGIAAWNLRDPQLLLVVASLAVLFAGLVIWKLLAFAEKNPAQALLEGAELIQWRQMEMAAKLSPPVAGSNEPPALEQNVVPK